MVRFYKKRFGIKRNFFSNLSATKILIYSNITFFVLVMIFISFIPNFFNYIALNPNNIFEGKYIWTFITSMFMHAPSLIPFHLFVNMFVLFSLGGMMEKIIGKKRFLVFYLISGLFAGLLFVFLSYFFGTSGIGAKIFGSPDISAVGASGAIFAVAGLFMILTPKLRFSIIFLPFFSLPAYVMIPLVLFGTWLVSSSAGFLIGNTAHFGGFLCGVLYGLYLKNKYPRKTKLLNERFR
ncbi:MAG: rhomboid family intramembrane serine protease [Nanoarchaeota archaeon]